MIVQIDPTIIKYDRKIQGLCYKPFYNHPKGCINIGRTDKGCPPGLPLIDEILDFNKEIYLIYTEFNVGMFAERMRRTHPEWKSQRQWYNPRLWQETARKNQRIETAHAKEEYDLEIITNSAEGHGVNLSALMKDSMNITLNWEWPPPHILDNEKYLDNKTYRISLGGSQYK